jgi:hypothetical protein
VGLWAFAQDWQWLEWLVIQNANAYDEAFLKDLPNAEINKLDSGHFAVEDCLDEIVSSINRFYFERVAKTPA